MKQACQTNGFFAANTMMAQMMIDDDAYNDRR